MSSPVCEIQLSKARDIYARNNQSAVIRPVYAGNEI
jgi:hypothetical protein